MWCAWTFVGTISSTFPYTNLCKRCTPKRALSTKPIIICVNSDTHLLRCCIWSLNNDKQFLGECILQSSSNNYLLFCSKLMCITKGKFSYIPNSASNGFGIIDFQWLVYLQHDIKMYITELYIYIVMLIK